MGDRDVVNMKGMVKVEFIKRPLILLEVLIGFTLASIVLGMLFTSLYQTSTISSRLEKAKKEVLGNAAFQQRLDVVFSHLITSETTPLYLTQTGNNTPILTLKFVSEIDPDPHFSDIVGGHLLLKDEIFFFQVTGHSLDKEGDSSLRNKKLLEQTTRTTVLKKGVKGVEYEFLRKGKPFSTWDEEEESSPDYLKITLTLDRGKKTVYVFWIHKDPKGVEIK